EQDPERVSHVQPRAGGAPRPRPRREPEDEEHLNQGEQHLPPVEEEVPRRHHQAAHVEATRPQKLYHLKNVSACEKPQRASSSRFSWRRYGIRTFSSASRFWAISSLV